MRKEGGVMASKWPARIAGGAAGLANGLFGGGGGMVFLPILSCWGNLKSRQLYATCVAVIFPVRRVRRHVPLAGRDELGLRPALSGGWAAGGLAGRKALRQSVHQSFEVDLRRLSLLRGGEVSAVTDWILPFFCGLGAAVISAWGVGGGTLLLLVMTLFLGVDQRTAQGINLLFFLPTAISALLCHWQKGYLDTPTWKAAVPVAVPAALAGAWIATAVDVDLLRRPFGIYLLLSGLSLIFPQKDHKTPGG